MGHYWRKSTKLLPGVRVNWSKNGPSLSVGPKGAKVNIGKRGTYVSGGIPGTGLYYRQKVGGGKKRNAPQAGAYSSPQPQPTDLAQSVKWSTIIGWGLILGLLLTGNLLTSAIVGAVWLGIHFYKKHKQNAQNAATSTSPISSQTAPVSSPVAAPPSAPSPASDAVDIKVAVAEVEHLVKEIDNTNDKMKLPQLYRKLMGIILKLEKIPNVTIMGLPVDEAKRRITENYRNKYSRL